ncbi:oxidoreductase, partial [Streptomyces tendae]
PRRPAPTPPPSRSPTASPTSSCCRPAARPRLDRLHRTHVHEVFDGVLEPGGHRVALDAGAVKGEAYVVARTPGSVLVTAVTRAPGRG